MDPADPNLRVTQRRLPLFSDLSEAELGMVADRATRRIYNPGATIFSEPCRERWIVGNSLAEVPIFEAGPCSATAIAIDATGLLRVEAEQFRKICLQLPEVAVKFIKVLGHRMRQLDDLVEALSFSSVRGHLITYLLQLAEDGCRSAAGLQFELREDNEELAVRLGTVGELVFRNLGRLHGQGLIAIRRRSVTIPDPAALQQSQTRNERASRAFRPP